MECGLVASGSEHLSGYWRASEGKGRAVERETEARRMDRKRVACQAPVNYSLWEQTGSRCRKLYSSARRLVYTLSRDSRLKVYVDERQISTDIGREHKRRRKGTGTLHSNIHCVDRIGKKFGGFW